MIEAQVRAATVDTPEAREERSPLRAQWSETPPVAGLRLHTPISLCAARPPYAGRALVLVDRGTGWSGEWATWELKRNRNTVLLGEQFAGGNQNGHVSLFVLLRTGLIRQIPTRRFFYRGRDRGGWTTD
jgi:C-terminal processing protease CtpA/Prc